MSKMSLTKALMLAGVVAAAGVAQAQQTFDSPQRAGEMSTMTMGQPNAETTNSPYSDGSHTMILGAGPATVTTYTYSWTEPAVIYSYSLPAPVVSYEYNGAAETSNVPLRAGEVSTMTGGAPNLLTMN
jgi:hypothetical protein